MARTLHFLLDVLNDFKKFSGSLAMAWVSMETVSNIFISFRIQARRLCAT